VDRFFAQNRLSALIDGVLSQAEADEVDRAIHRNPDLATQHAGMLQAVELMHEVGPQQAPRGFQVRLMTEVETLPVPGGQVARVRSAARQIPMEAIALAALALVIGVVVHQRKVPDAPSANVTPRAAAPAAVSSKGVVKTAPSVEETAIPDVPSSKPPPRKVKVAPPESDIPDRLPPVYVDLTRPAAYKILGGGDQVLFKISSLGDTLGGRMVNGKGQPISPQLLSEDLAFKMVFLVVPVSKAAAAHQSLRQLSGQTSRPIQEKFNWLKVGQTVFMIEAEL